MKFINRIPNTNTWVEWSSEDIGSDWKPLLWALATILIGAPIGIYIFVNFAASCTTNVPPCL